MSNNSSTKYKIISEKEIGFGKLYYVITTKEFDSLEKDSKILNPNFLEKYLDVINTKRWVVFRKYNEKIKSYYLKVEIIPSEIKDEKLEEQFRTLIETKDECQTISTQGKEFDIYENKFLEKGTLVSSDEVTIKFFISHFKKVKP